MSPLDNSSISAVSRLPDPLDFPDIWDTIGNNLSIKDLGRVARVSKNINTFVTTSRNLWENRLQSEELSLEKWQLALKNNPSESWMERFKRLCVEKKSEDLSWRTQRGPDYFNGIH